jgi:hypothetical protein
MWVVMVEVSEAEAGPGVVAGDPTVDSVELRLTLCSHSEVPGGTDVPFGIGRAYLPYHLVKKMSRAMACKRFFFFFQLVGIELLEKR